MLFCSPSLAARIESAERDLLAAGASVMTGVFVRRFAGGIAVASLAGSPLNKVAGLGFGGPVDLAILAAIEAEFAARGVPVQVEVATLADPVVVQALTRRGYALVGFEDVLGLALPAQAPAAWPAGVSIAPVSDDEREAWIDAVITAFMHPDAQGVPAHDAPEAMDRGVIEPVLRDFARTPCLSTFIARRGGVIAGGASMAIQGGVALLCGAATLPAHRRNGVQTALLADRLARAAAGGCDIAVLTALPGSKSHENAQRRGFELLYARAVLVKDSAPRP